MKIFISYAHVDRYRVREMVNILRDDAGHDPWFDHLLVAGKPWADQLSESIESCDCFLYAMTPESMASKWCQWEFAQAVHMGKPVIPVLIQAKTEPGVLSRIQYVDFSDGPTGSSVARLLRGVREAVCIPVEWVPEIPIPHSKPERPTEQNNKSDAQLFFEDARAAFRERDFETAHDWLTACLDLESNHAGAKALLKRVEQRLEEKPSALLLENGGYLLLEDDQSAETPVVPPVAQVQEQIAPLPDDPVAAAIQRAREFTGKCNSDWEPFVTTFDDCPIPDMPFCLVPVGSFLMGSNDGYDDEKPAHEQHIQQPYWVAQYPVTNAQWKLAVQAGVVKQPYDMDRVLKWYNDPAMANVPVTGVNWFMAQDFVMWLGGHLPSELEWEYAAGGVENLRYPWGNDWNSNIPVWDKNSGGKTAVVMSKLEETSWVAAAHMVGNVWEWTNSLAEPYSYHAQDGRERDTGDNINVQRVLRGGSFLNSDTYYLRATYRGEASPGNDGDGISFRCVRSIEP